MGALYYAFILFVIFLIVGPLLIFLSLCSKGGIGCLFSGITLLLMLTIAFLASCAKFS